jgi:hypothetical protein
MKKNVFLLCALTQVLFSCEGPMGPQGAPGEGMNWEIMYYTVHENDWKLVGGKDDLNSYYMYDFDEPLLTGFIYGSGKVVGYRILNIGQKDETLTPLPDVIPVGGSDAGGEFLWTENYTFDYMPGSVAFFVYYSDFSTGVKPPTCDFRIVMNW